MSTISPSKVSEVSEELDVSEVSKESRVSDLITECLNDKNVDRNECGNEIEDYEEVDVYFSVEFKIKCKVCGYENETYEFYGMCDGDNCAEYYEHETINENDIKENCEYLEFEIEDCVEFEYGGSYYSDLSKIKFDDDDMYGIMLCTASFEENSWNSSPHNSYTRKFMIYNNKEKRDEAYTNYDSSMFY